MLEYTELKSLEEEPAFSRVAGQLMVWAMDVRSPDDFLARALPPICDLVDARNASVLHGDRGRWTVVCSFGSEQALPYDLLAAALDQEKVVTEDDWLVAPLEPRSATSELLVVGGLRQPAGELAGPVAALARLLGEALRSLRDRQRDQARIERLEAILEIAGQWRQTQEMDALLTQMAEASTRLMDCERASIFLWDKPNGMLVGRPALGVEGGELRIPDDMGVVGKVVQTGEPRRVDLDLGQQEIDRKVDKKLGFQTRTLLCVPLRGADGDMLGAFELINKLDGNFHRDDELALNELAAHAAIALESMQQVGQLIRSRKQMADQAAEGVQLIGQCPAIEALGSTVKRVADTDLAILILGENGTGKEVVAQQIHYLSRRRNEPLVAVNCAALTETLLESELFGHEKGAFTDARETRVGKFELATGGTLFLDEIGDMSLGGQAKLLRVLEEKVVVRVGGSIPIHTDARVIAATNQSLAEMVRAKRFREDLFFRLNVVTLELPPMRERGDDILLLADHFLKDFCVKARRAPPKLTPAARKRLLRHTWPGNVRELRNLMERLAYLSTGDKIDADELAFILAPDAESPAMFSLDLPLTEATMRFQMEYIKKHIDAARGNMTDAAQRLGLHRSNLYRKMRQLGMEASTS